MKLRAMLLVTVLVAAGLGVASSPGLAAGEFGGNEPGTGGCGESRQPLDVSLVLDRSGSMGGLPIQLAREGAAALVDNLTTLDQSGLVSYASSARLDQSVSFDHQATRSAILNMFASGSTNTGGGIDVGHNDLVLQRRAEARSVMILLTDGFANTGPDPVTEARQAKLDGIEIYAIGLGSSVNEGELRQIASDPVEAHYFNPPTAEALVEVFEDLTARLVLGGAHAASAFGVHVEAADGTVREYPRGNVAHTENRTFTDAFVDPVTLKGVAFDFDGNISFVEEVGTFGSSHATAIAGTVEVPGILKAQGLRVQASSSVAPVGAGSDTEVSFARLEVGDTVIEAGHYSLPEELRIPGVATVRIHEVIDTGNNVTDANVTVHALHIILHGASPVSDIYIMSATANVGCHVARPGDDDPSDVTVTSTPEPVYAACARSAEATAPQRLPSDPIAIDGDIELLRFTLANGRGTPLRIANLDIAVPEGEQGLVLRGTTLPVVVENVRFTGAPLVAALEPTEVHVWARAYETTVNTTRTDIRASVDGGDGLDPFKVPGHDRPTAPLVIPQRVAAEAARRATSLPNAWYAATVPLPRDVPGFDAGDPDTEGAPWAGILLDGATAPVTVTGSRFEGLAAGVVTVNGAALPNVACSTFLQQTLGAVLAGSQAPVRVAVEQTVEPGPDVPVALDPVTVQAAAPAVLTFAGNIVEGAPGPTGGGVLMYQPHDGLVVTVRDNDFKRLHEAGFALFEGNGDAAGVTVTVDDNLFNRNDWGGVDIYPALAGATVAATGNTVTDNAWGLVNVWNTVTGSNLSVNGNAVAANAWGALDVWGSVTKSRIDVTGNDLALSAFGVANLWDAVTDSAVTYVGNARTGAQFGTLAFWGPVTGATVDLADNVGVADTTAVLTFLADVTDTDTRIAGEVMALTSFDAIQFHGDLTGGSVHVVGGSFVNLGANNGGCVVCFIGRLTDVDVRVEDTVMTDFSFSGVELAGSLTGGAFVLDRNVFYDNDQGGVILWGEDGPAGRELARDDAVITIRNNTFTGNGRGAQSVPPNDIYSGGGVLLYGATPPTGVVVDDNAFYANAQMAVGLNAGVHASINRNTLFEHTQSAVWTGFLHWACDCLGAAPTAVLRDNYFRGNDFFGVEHAHPARATPLDARENYWGHGSGPRGAGPGIGDGVSADVLYAPWYQNEAQLLVGVVT